MKKTLIVILLGITFHIACIAQDYRHDGQKITTDYNSCLEGVKDTLGNWVIQPSYDEIQSRYDKYIVQSGGKYGVLSRKGVVLIPLIYDHIGGNNGWENENVSLDGFFEVRVKNVKGVVDTQNRVIIPIAYEEIWSYYDSTFVAQKSKRSYDFYDSQGTCFPCPWKSKWKPEHESYRRYTMRRRSLTGYRFGMLNDSGKVILPRKYNYVECYYGRGIVRIEQNKKYGYCSKAGAVIWPMVFHSEYYTEGDNWVGQFGIGSATLNGKSGLISDKGDTILPFLYSAIYPLDGYETPYLWKVSNDSLSGIYDTRSGWLLQPICASIIEVATFTNPADTSSVSLLVAEINGKWGAMTTAGQIIVPFEYDEELYGDRKHIFRKGDSLIALGVTTLNDLTRFHSSHFDSEELLIFWSDNDILNVSEVPVNNTFSVFEGKNGVKAFYHPGETRDSIFRNDSVINIISGAYHGMSVPDSIFVASCFYTIPLRTPTVDQIAFDIYSYPSIVHSENHSGQTDIDFCVLQTDKGPELSHFTTYLYPYFFTQRGDVIKITGEVIISADTSDRIDYEYHHNNGQLYFTSVRYNPYRICAVDTNGKSVHPYSGTEFEEFTDRFTWYYHKVKKKYGYVLIDNKTGVNVLGKNVMSDRVYPVWDSITIVETQTSGMRLFNLNQGKYFTENGFDEIVPLRADGTLFGIKTCSRKLGVLNAQGQFVLDTIYTALTLGDQLDYFRNSGAHRADFYCTTYSRVVFYNDSVSTELDLLTKKTTPLHSLYDARWMEITESIPQQIFETFIEDSLKPWYQQHRFTVFMGQQDSAMCLPWQKQCLIDSIFAPRRILAEQWLTSSYRCNYCREISGYSLGIDWTLYPPGPATYVVGYRSDSLLSFCQFEKLFFAYEGVRKSIFSNVMMFPDGPHQLTIDSLFNPANDWRNFIINSLLTYVNTHNEIEGDCHNPASIPLSLSQRFEIKPEGLLLYPPGFKENNKQLVLRISWTELNPYLRNDIKHRLPIGNP